MRISEAWLREWVDLSVDTQTLAEQLTMAGLEVDSLEPAAADFSGVVIGLVLSVDQHPDADKLRVCKVDVNREEPLSIVCGAANVASGMRVPVATLGGVLPGGFKIKRAKLRGVESFGMICSASELGLAESSDGIMPLPDDAPVGDDIRDYLALDDTCIDIDLTPNRGDCLSLGGVAREVGVMNSAPVTMPDVSAVEPEHEERFPVKLEAPEACPRYVCRIVKGIDPKAGTPMWMQERLRRGGVRCLGPVVDVTNYVMLELGQPMHGFDLGVLNGEIRVRMAESGETMTMLDGEEITLRDDTLVIADAQAPLAMAGIMGGANSGVTEETTDILLESAFFSPTAIVGKPRSYAMQTDSAHRFERGVDPELQVPAIERATALLVSIAGGTPGPVSEHVADGFETRQEPVALRRDRLARVLGVEVDEKTVADILTRLDMKVQVVDNGWSVVPPARRFDIAIEEDLIEEIGRIYGYDNIPEAAGSSGIALQGAAENRFDLDEVQRLLISRDYQEVITYSFISPDLANALVPNNEPIRLANPLSADMAVMRPTLWAGLLETAKYNQARQQDRIRIFESGLKFISQDNEIKQEKMLSALIQGNAAEKQWGLDGRAADFYDLKADVEAILALTGAPEEFRFQPDTHPSLHPGQSARIIRGELDVGWMGLLHPKLEKELDVGRKSYVVEINLASLEDRHVPDFVPISRFPAIRRDLALVVDENVSFAEVKQCASEAAPAILQDIKLFDVYTGQNIELKRKSLALSLILQDSSRTLTDQDVASATDVILEALNKKLNIKLRD